MSKGSSILKVRDLQVRKAGVLILDIPALQIEEGELLSLIGPNGGGKSTLLQTLASLTKLSAGEIIFKGELVTADSGGFAYRRKLAMVFQDPLLFDTTVFENVASGLWIRGMKKQEVNRIVDENLERFGIRHLLQRSARKISGGEAQRVALARAFATHPEILFLDEPFASLDPPTRESLLTDLEAILRQTGTTTLMATHDRLEALRFSDRIAVMNQGKIFQNGSPYEVMNHPVDEFVASFVGMESILEGKVVSRDRGSSIISVEGKEIEAVGEFPLGGGVSLCIRPENVTLAVRPAQEATSARNSFPGKVEKIVALGLYYKIMVDCGFPLVAYVTAHSLENLDLKAGKEVIAIFKATAIHVVKRREKIQAAL
ncbi:MAG: ABC transporter ATP-binding protein [Deltaproteobacteria bacterium]|nr:ABC transporter ATP-binding protein [Deltaproteobacteria bacterium]